jgi:hypothetical protein
MLEQFEKFAGRHQGWRQPILLAMVVSAAGFFLMVIGASSEALDSWLIPVVLLMLWLLQFYSGLALFAHVPPLPEEHQPWWPRLRRRLHRGCYHLFAWFMLAVTVAWTVTSFQLLMAWLRMAAA